MELKYQIITALMQGNKFESYLYGIEITSVYALHTSFWVLIVPLWN